MRVPKAIESTSEQQGERLVRLLSGATFLIFFQAYMIAPLVPKLAFGSTLGVLLEPLVGWRNLFVGVGALGLARLVLLRRHRPLLGHQRRVAHTSASAVLKAYGKLLAGWRGARTYTYVLVNAIFHSGVYTWLGLYFAERYRLGEIGIGLALLGYGVPGFILGPVIGRIADRWGRRWLIPAGLGIAALASVTLALGTPVLLAGLRVTALSLGYDMTQPLLAGIVTTLDREREVGRRWGLTCLRCSLDLGWEALSLADC